MRNLLILAHPDEKSFQASLAEAIMLQLEKSGQEVCFLNLYEEGFPPLLPLEEIQRGSSSDSLVLQHQRDLKSSDRILLFYPDWWGLPPAILKGWLDRVLAPEVAYRWEGEDFLDKKWIPLLEGKKIGIYVTADSKVDPHWLNYLWNDRIFGPCGSSVQFHFLDRMREQDFSDRQKWIEEKTREILNL